MINSRCVSNNNLATVREDIEDASDMFDQCTCPSFYRSGNRINQMDVKSEKPTLFSLDEAAEADIRVVALFL